MEENHTEEKIIKKSLSIPDMGKLLGLRKTDSYYLANKGWFRIIIVSGKRRVDMDSFEEWYRRQKHYRKINGSSYSVGTDPVPDMENEVADGIDH